MSPRLGTSNMVRDAPLPDIRFQKKQIPGSLNAARDLWVYSALRMSFCGCIWAGSVTGFPYSLRWGFYDPGNAWDF